MVATGFFCAAQSNRLTSDSVYAGGLDSVYAGSLDSTKTVQNQKPLPNNKGAKFNTRYEYTESNAARLIIQNSFPKSAIHYTDPDGKKYRYAVFWTQITNETAIPLKVAIDFTLDSFEIPSSPGTYMKLLLPSDTMTIDKDPLFDYGLNLKAFVDKNLYKSSSLKRTINPGGSTAFYVVAIFNKGVDGIIRTGLSLREQNLFYRINDKEIHCGSINLNLK